MATAIITSQRDAEGLKWFAVDLPGEVLASGFERLSDATTFALLWGADKARVREGSRWTAVRLERLGKGRLAQ